MSHGEKDAARGEGDVLALRDVRKVFRSDVLKSKQIAVDNLTLGFAKGACTGLLGHNGAGKTTTIRLILGLVRPDTGTIYFEGRPLTVSDKRHIGYMPETNKLPQALTPSEILNHQLKLTRPEGTSTKASRRALIAETLAKVGLKDHSKKRIAHLSKGMGRRLAWAQATIHRPRLLILDEPSSGLDPIGRQDMLTWIAAEKDRGTSIVLCTHELEQVHELCDDYHVLKHGRLVLSTNKSPTTTLLGAILPRYYVQISGVTNEQLDQLQSSLGLPPWTSLAHQGFLSKLGFDDYTKAAAWLGAAIQRGLMVLRFGDEVFVSEDELLRLFGSDAS